MKTCLCHKPMHEVGKYLLCATGNCGRVEKIIGYAKQGHPVTQVVMEGHDPK